MRGDQGSPTCRARDVKHGRMNTSGEVRAAAKAPDRYALRLTRQSCCVSFHLPDYPHATAKPATSIQECDKGQYCVRRLYAVDDLSIWLAFP